jgi:hypothetical protein
MPQEHIDFYLIISYWTSNIWSFWHMSFKGNQLPPHRLLFPISSKGSFICTLPQTGQHIPRPLMNQLWTTGWNGNLEIPFPVRINNLSTAGEISRHAVYRTHYCDYFLISHQLPFWALQARYLVMLYINPLLWLFFNFLPVKGDNPEITSF